jgi:molybdopterin molybdotransferase
LLTFVLFGAPLLRAMQGDARPTAPFLIATLGARVAHQPGRTEFIRATLDGGEAGMVVHPLRNQASGAVTSFAWADTLAVIPAEVGDLAVGDRVQCMRLCDV